MDKEQIKKRDALVAMHTYAHEYLENRIREVKLKGHDEMAAEYSEELEEIKGLFDELFFKIHKGEI